ncbi:hypothetical protein D3C72_2078330 [compost metagenome]
MARVDPQIGIAQLPDERNRRWRNRPQATPEFRFSLFIQLRKQFPGTAHQQVAANGILIVIEAGNFGGTGDPKPVTEPGKDNFVFIVNQAHRRGNA